MRRARRRIRGWFGRLEGLTDAAREAAPSALAGVGVVVGAALLVLLAGLALAVLASLLD